MRGRKTSKVRDKINVQAAVLVRTLQDFNVNSAVVTEYHVTRNHAHDFCTMRGRKTNKVRVRINVQAAELVRMLRDFNLNSAVVTVFHVREQGTMRMIYAPRSIIYT